MSRPAQRGFALLPTGAQRGFALLIVLWVMVFLAFLLSQILSSGRVAIDLAANLRAAAQNRAAADGAIANAVFHLLAPGSTHWPVDGQPRIVTIGATKVVVNVQDLDGMVNPNLASAGLLAALLQGLAVPPDQAATLAAAIVAWRSPPESPTAGAAALNQYRQAGLAYGPPGKQFETLSELNDVIGMTPAIYSALAPHCSLFQPGDPDPQLADKVVQHAIMVQAAGFNPNGSGYEGAPVAAISACTKSGLCRHAVVSLAGLNASTPYRMLSLEDAH